MYPSLASELHGLSNILLALQGTAIEKTRKEM
jgi:hypothetical protein